MSQIGSTRHRVYECYWVLELEGQWECMWWHCATRLGRLSVYFRLISSVQSTYGYC